MVGRAMISALALWGALLPTYGMAGAVDKERCRRPKIKKLLPPQGYYGEPIPIQGRRFGKQPGTVRFAPGVDADIVTWRDKLIETTVPDGAQTGEVQVLSECGKWSKGKPFAVVEEKGQWSWVAPAGREEADGGTGIALDSEGNVLSVGWFYGKATFGETTLKARGEQDVFVAKSDASGSFIWATSAGGRKHDVALDVAMDLEGNVIVVGYFEGRPHFGATELRSEGDFDVFVAKLDPNGDFLWAVRAGGSGYDSGRDVDVDSDGNVLVVGAFSRKAQFGATELKTDGKYDVFVTKLDPDGNFLWAAQGKGRSNDFGRGITVDSNDEALITGYFCKGIQFGETALTSEGESDIFVAKLDGNGSLLWAVQAGGPGGGTGSELAVDPEGSVLVTGCFSKKAWFGPTMLRARSDLETFVAKLDGDGNFLWAVPVHGTDRNWAWGLAPDADGNALITGWLYGKADFGDTRVMSRGGPNAFVAKLNGEGAFVWAVSGGGADGAAGFAIAVDPQGDPLISGRFIGRARFGDLKVKSAGEADAFVAKVEAHPRKGK